MAKRVETAKPNDCSDWLSLDVEGTRWRVDRSFLMSNWTCIWNSGCAGIEDEIAIDTQLGCCSVGAQMVDVPEAMLITALGATLPTERAQYADEIAAGGVLNAQRSNTRTVDGACIFLNRPGFAGGAGCALHAEAIRLGESPTEWKPSVCWQLPLKVEHELAEDGTDLATLRRWSRADWGSDGETMAFCCTEDDSVVANAFVGEQPVMESLSDELQAIVGVRVYEAMAEELGSP